MLFKKRDIEWLELNFRDKDFFDDIDEDLYEDKNKPNNKPELDEVMD